MPSELLEFIKSLPQIAKQPLAIIGYCFLVGGWVFLAYRRNRSSHFLRTLEKLPKVERIRFCSQSGYSYDELVQLPKSERLKLLTRRYLLIAFIITVLAFLLFGALVLHNLELKNRLDQAQMRDAPGSELLAEFRQRIERAAFSALAANSDERVGQTLAELARERGMTVDELRKRILQAAAGARERILLASQFRGASEYEAVRLKPIERSGYEDLASAAVAQEHYQEALDDYKHALDLTEMSSDSRKWADLQNSLGICEQAIGIRMEGPAATQYLADAALAFNAALQVLARERLPLEWARVQNNLAIVFSEQATRSEGTEAFRFTSQAVSAYRAALMVASRDSDPQNWATLQNNLGNALRHQAALSEGDGAFRLLGEAVAAIRAALQVVTRDKFPEAWASAQINLSIILRHQAEKAVGPRAPELSAEAVAACRAALQVYTREQFPPAWALSQDTLGNELRDQADRSEGAEAVRLLSEAEAAFRSALGFGLASAFPRIGQ